MATKSAVEPQPETIGRFRGDLDALISSDASIGLAVSGGPDSLFYLGQSLMKLGQPGQACKAYAELDAVYGAKVRPDLKKLESDAKAEAQCS